MHSHNPKLDLFKTVIREVIPFADFTEHGMGSTNGIETFNDNVQELIVAFEADPRFSILEDTCYYEVSLLDDPNVAVLIFVEEKISSINWHCNNHLSAVQVEQAISFDSVVDSITEVSSGIRKLIPQALKCDRSAIDELQVVLKRLKEIQFMLTPTETPIHENYNRVPHVRKHTK